MKLKSFCLTMLCAATIAAPSVNDQTFTPAQKTAIQQMIRAEIQDNPMSIIRSIQALQKRSLKQEKNKSLAVAKQLKQSLVFNTQDPSIGPKKANVTVIEFLDYQCGHCRTMAKTMEHILATDKNVRLVVKELPIFKGNSLLAAKAAVAASKQGKFATMHHAIFNFKGPLNDSNLTTLARQQGLDINTFNQNRHNTDVSNLIQQNFVMAKKLGFQGTPAFIVTSTYGHKMVVLPGAVPEKILASAIQDMRS